jgi:hypothetical protein
MSSHTAHSLFLLSFLTCLRLIPHVIYPLNEDAHNVSCPLVPERYIMEDRFSAIRAAIGTAAPGDVVVIAGRGHVDFMDYWDGEVRGKHRIKLTSRLPWSQKNFPPCQNEDKANMPECT